MVLPKPRHGEGGHSRRIMMFPNPRRRGSGHGHIYELTGDKAAPNRFGTLRREGRERRGGIRFSNQGPSPEGREAARSIGTRRRPRPREGLGAIPIRSALGLDRRRASERLSHRVP
jgi:hypothetical protein